MNVQITLILLGVPPLGVYNQNTEGENCEFQARHKKISRKQQVLLPSLSLRYAVAEWYEAGLCDREVAGSTTARGCCVPTPTQRAIPPGSVNEY